MGKAPRPVYSPPQTSRTGCAGGAERCCHHIDRELAGTHRQGQSPRPLTYEEVSSLSARRNRRHRPHRRRCSPRSTASASNSSTAPTPIAAIWPSRKRPSRDGDRAFVLDRRHAARFERSDSHVPVADGEHSAADARRGNPPGEEDRAHPQALPPQHAAVVLRAWKRR